MNQQKTITVKDIIAALDHLVKPLNDTRVKDWAKFHRDVEALIGHFVKHELGLSVGIWEIKKPFNINDPADATANAELFKYNRDFKPDANSTHRTMRGRVTRVYFEQSFGGDPNRTLFQYINLARVDILKLRLEGARAELAEITKKRNEQEARVIALETELNGARRVYSMSEGGFVDKTERRGPYKDYPGFCEWCGVHPCKCKGVIM